MSASTLTFKNDSTPNFNYNERLELGFVNFVKIAILTVALLFANWLEGVNRRFHPLYGVIVYKLNFQLPIKPDIDRK